MCPLTTTGPGELVVQTADEPSSVADCKVNPAALVGHVKMTLASEGIIVSCGALTLADPNERLNTPPAPTPPFTAVPYRVLPDKINPASGPPASPKAPVQLCRVVKVCAVTRPGSIKPRPANSAGTTNQWIVRVFIIAS